jgi:ketosteroid isomerase-like protein
MIDAKWAKEFAGDWIASWNSHDLDRILSHYTDDFEMVSPFIITRMKEPSGTLKGKEKVRPYWQIGLAAQLPLKFELIEVLIGVKSIALHYRRTSGKPAIEILVFNDEGKVVRGIAHYSD